MASTIKVDNVQNTPGTNIINKCSTTITLGACGDTVSLASGASQSGFGRAGSVDWQTGSIKTGTFTAATGEGYFVNTSGGIATVNLPAGAAGSIVAISDYTRTFNSNNCTVTPNGSEKIGGADAGTSATLSVDGQSATFVYVDGTEGWINVQETQTSQTGTSALYVTATGGTPCTGAICGNFKTHVFTGPGTLTVSCGGNACGSNTVDYFVSAGGGGGGGVSAAGAGGFRVSNSVGCIAAPVMSPLANPTGITVSATPYAIVVGGGGAAGCGSTPGPGCGAAGGCSSFSTITSTGGGKGRGYSGTGFTGGSGSGGSAGPTPTSGYAGGAGNTPPFSPPQGNPGGSGYDGLTASTNGGGGGGAGATGGNAAAYTGGDGGAGSYLGDAFFKTACAPSYGEPGPAGSTRYFGGGAGGGTDSGLPPASGGTGGVGGGGNGGQSTNTATAGSTNMGAGGGGAGTSAPGGGGTGGAGGSGIVIIRYKFQ